MLTPTPQKKTDFGRIQLLQTQRLLHGDNGVFRREQLQESNVFGTESMATTQRAQYRFRLREGPDLTHEPRPGVIELVTALFIRAEPCDRTPVSQLPLREPDFLAFDLPLGTSFDKAQRIADFMNQNLLYVSICRFGDAEDAVRDVALSERSDDSARFFHVICDLKTKLEAGDMVGAINSIKSVEYLAGELVRQWRKALGLAREILRKFGQDKDPDALV